ncbi:uncharacterized protein LOC129575012 isoform X2 [Sitodiplosis mosellana]|uniref:uncharacterized protein LOC129575012 isoform X2 n=1 Tax=Sitodiplosis mosellana TaxID=263140 RepID=UPI002444D1F1|nr:uncharacterized protein LOC129575012 isoform X2 [Sitodiplosis mosellana]XP_055313784.1 uncharacterized protein LOC129575012 isoform X2 [Sitodiplosis mosellana]
MSKKSFSSIYSEYTKFYGEKNHAQCLEVFARFDLKSSYANYSEQVNFLLRSACYCLFSLKNPNERYNVSIANGYKNVLSEAANGSDYEKFLSILSYFLTNSDRYLALISGLSSSATSDWLRATNKYIFQVLKNANIVDDVAHIKRKEIYLQLTQALLIFVYAEVKQASLSKSSWKFDESRSFLSSCQQFNLFQEGESIRQYSLCFEMLDKFLVALSSEAGNGKLGQAIETFLKHLKSLTKSNEVRATLTQDNYVTLAKILKAYTPQFVQTVDPKNVAGCFKVIEYVGRVVKQVKSTKPFCTDCNSIGEHCTHELAVLASEMYSTLIEKETGEPIEEFANIIQYDFDAVCKLKCAKMLDTQRDAVSKVRNLARKCESKENAKFMIPVIKSLLKRYNKFKLMEEQLLVNSFDVVYMLNHLFTILNATDRWEEVVDVGYLYMAFHSSVPNHPSGNFEHIVWTLAKKQKDNKATKTPYDNFSKPTEESLYGLKLPDNLNINKLSLDLLRVGFKYGILTPDLSNRVINQLLEASMKNSDSLRFALSVQSMKFDKETSERVDKLVSLFHAKSKKDLSIALQLAAIKYLRLNFEGTQIQDKYSNLSISEALSEAQIASQTSIFRDITFDQEKTQIETLRYVKDKFIGFVQFYLSKTDEERQKFNDEKELLLRELKVVANQFVVRGYMEDGFELYMALFKLSKEIQDEFGLIDACSFFAENSSDFKQKFSKENLQSIIEECFAACVEKLKYLNHLSTRKQTQVCFCILNLVLYYYEDSGKYEKEIHLILAFIFKTIGGTGDEKMEKTMEALIGSIEKAKTNNEIRKSFSEAIRIKFYSVLFTIITKYGAPSAFHPTKFIQFVMNHIKTYLSVYYDNTAAVPILLYNVIPEMVMWLEGHYQLNVDIPALVLTLLKLSLKSGYANRSVNLMIVLLQMDLLGEKLTPCKTKLKALEYVMLSEAPTSTEYKKSESPVYAIDNNKLCEPIRKQATATSPMKCLSPKQSVGSLTTQSIRYLPNHANGCECGICFSPQNKFFIFCVAVAYARYVYVNDEEFDARTKRAVFTELLKYWEKCRKEKTLPKNDWYYIVSARMLSYDAHFKWKFEKDYSNAVDQLLRGLKGLERVKNGANTLKYDLQHQVDRMNETIRSKEMTREERYAGPNYIIRNKGFVDQVEAQPKKKAQPATKTAAKSRTPALVVSTPKPRVNLLDMINKEPTPKFANFQIHDDGAVGGAEITPSLKRSTRSQRKKVDETPVRKASVWEILDDDENNVAKTSERPKRVPKSNAAPTDYIDLASDLPPPKINFKRNLPTIHIDLTSPPEKNAENNEKSTPETPITSKPPQISGPKKPKCPPKKDARKVVVNETYLPKQ